MSSVSFSVIVPTFRRPETLRATLAALAAQNYPKTGYEVIVVDDDASSATPDVVAEALATGCHLTLVAQNQEGAARARNQGARRAAGDLLLFLDDDILVEPDHLRRHWLVRASHRDPIVGGCWDFTPAVLAALRSTPFGRYRLALERSFQAGTGGRALDDGRLQVEMLPSTDLAIRRELFWQLGGFDERFPVAGAEDQDFSIRARLSGCLLILDRGIRCFHNDNRLTLRSYCEREERSAKTMPILARNYPAQFRESAYIRENRPPRRDEPPPLIAKKLVKAALSRPRPLEGIHRLTTLAERMGLPERLLRRLYSLLLGLHLFRGFRSTWYAANRRSN